MSNTIYVVRNPSGKACGVGFRESDAWDDALVRWETTDDETEKPSIVNGYTCEAIAPPSAHDAAIVAAAEAAYDAHVVAAHCPCTEGLCRHDTDAMYQDGELHDAVLAKREATDA